MASGRSWVVTSLAAVVIGTACNSTTSCSCTNFDGLLVHVATAAVGDTIEVCHAAACGTATVEVVIPRVEVSIPATELGAWASQRGLPVAVTVRRAAGDSTPPVTVVPRRHGSCCGDYWDASI